MFTMKNVYYLFFIIILAWNVQSDQGKRIHLIQAVKQEKADIIDWLVSEEANVNIQDEYGKTPLMYAACLENKTILVKLIDEGAQTDLVDKNGRWIVHYAAQYGRIETLKYLRELEMNVTAIDFEGMTPLHLASARGHVDVVKYLLDEGEDPYMTNKENLTSIHIAAINGHVPILSLFLNNRLDIDTVAYANGSSPLNLAALYNQTDTCKFLMESRASVASKNDNKWSIIHSAAYSGNINLIEMFIERNASFDLVDINGQSPMYIAVKRGFLEVAQYFVKINVKLSTTDNSGNTLMHAAAYSGNIKLIKFLTNKKILLDVKNKIGSTPLLVACLQGHADLVRHFVTYQCDVNAVDINGQTAIHAAIKSGNLILVKYLIGKGVSLSSKDIDSRTPLHTAALHGSMTIVSLITQAIANQNLNVSSLTQQLTIVNQRCIECVKQQINAKDKTGKTPVYLAAESGKFHELKFLIEHGANYTLNDNLGRSPLHAIASNGPLNALNYLLLLNTDIDLRDSLGQTPIFAAIKYNQVKSFHCLLEAGADLKIMDEMGRTVLHIAAETGNQEILKVLTKNIEVVRLIEHKDKLNRSPAWYAVKNNNLKSLDLLVASKAKITADLLTEAIDANNIHLLRALIWNGGSPNMVADGKHQGILEYAVRKANASADIIQCLIDLGAVISPREIEYLLKSSLQVENFKIFQTLGQQKDVKILDYCPYLLRNEVANNHLKILQYLVSIGCESNITYPRQKNITLLHIAAERGSLESLEFLISNGISINATDEDDKTPIFYAIKNNQLTIFEYLYPYYKNKNSFDDLILTATQESSLDIIKYLLDHVSNLYDEETNDQYLYDEETNDRFNPNYYRMNALKKIYKNGKSLLHEAVETNYGPLVGYLLDSGADVAQEDSNGNQTVHLAIRYKNSLIQLLQHGFRNFDERNRAGKTPLQLAYESNNIESGKCLLKYGDTNSVDYQYGDYSIRNEWENLIQNVRYSSNQRDKLDCHPSDQTIKRTPNTQTISKSGDIFSWFKKKP